MDITRDIDGTRTTRTGRVDTVDFARGIAALGVMVYHLLWAEHIATISRVGFYFVYAFFMISGFSLYINYADRLGSTDEIRTYVVKRFRRIAPLFYLTCALQILLAGAPNFQKVLLNFSLMFGFANPGSTSMIMGGWSIGIEMVFYVAFPLVVLLTRRSIVAVGGLAMTSTMLMIAFVNVTLSSQPEMTPTLWGMYTQPAAFFGYFAFGCLISEAFLRYEKSLKGHWSWLVVLGIAIVTFVSIQVEQVNDLVTGWTGVVLMISVMLAITAIAFIREPTGTLHSIALWLGRLSYPIYLLHPIVYSHLTPKMASWSVARIAVTVAATVVISALVYKTVEKPLMNLKFARQNRLVL